MKVIFRARSCFVDFSKVFHRVNYWKLFHKLLDDGVDSKVARTLMFCVV